MSITALSGPLVVFGQESAAPGQDYNPELGPSLLYGGAGLLDPRPAFAYQPGQNFGNQTSGFLDAFSSMTVNYVPSTLAAANISAAALLVASTPVTLVSSTGSGITVGVTIINQNTGFVATSTSGTTTSSTVLGIDIPTAAMTGTINSGVAGVAGTVLTITSIASAVTPLSIGMTLTGTNVVAGTTIVGFGTGGGWLGTYQVSTPQNVTSTTITGTQLTGNNTVPFGSSGTIQPWNPVALCARNISCTGVSGGTGGTALISGYDVYGFPMSQLLTLPTGAAKTTTTKCFKYISSIVPQAASLDTTHNYSFGTDDTYGFPLRSDLFLAGGPPVDVQIWWNGAQITATTGYTAAVVTSPATTATGDVRGSYNVQTGSNGTKQLVIVQAPSLPNTASATGLFGVNQV